MGEKGAIVDAFVDRIEELAALEEQFADHQAAMVVIYGRRRIGKTALITEFVRDKRALYFLATEESEEQNRAAFQKQVAAFTGDELLGQIIEVCVNAFVDCRESRTKSAWWRFSTGL